MREAAHSDDFPHFCFGTVFFNLPFQLNTCVAFAIRSGKVIYFTVRSRARPYHSASAQSALVCLSYKTHAFASQSAAVR